MGNQRKTYSKEFKQDALDLVKSSGKNVSEVARDLGIDSGLLCRWNRETRQESDGKKAFTGNGRPRDEVLAQLQKENADLKVTNDILKKAVAIFSLTENRK